MKRGSLKVFDVVLDNGSEIKKTRQFAHSQNEVKEYLKKSGSIPVKITKSEVEFLKEDLYNALSVLPEGQEEIFREILDCCDIFGGDN